MKVESKETEVFDGVFAKFGRSKQEQIDAWLELSNAMLMSECQKYGLAVSDKHIHNIQALFNYLKQFEDVKKTPKPSQSTVTEQSQSQIALSLNDNFIRKKQPEPEREIRDNKNDVNRELGKIFARKRILEQHKISIRTQGSKKDQMEMGVTTEYNPHKPFTIADILKTSPQPQVPGLENIEQSKSFTKSQSYQSKVERTFE